MPVPQRLRKPVISLACLVAVVAIGWSGTHVWHTWRAHQKIDEACAGLVPAGRVLALSPAGGTISHRTAEEGTIELDAGMPQDCEIFSTKAGEAYRTHSGERWFFTGAVGVLPSDETWKPEDWMDRPLRDQGPNYPDEPLGGGIAGVVTNSGVTVELPCAEGKASGQSIKALWARATLEARKPPFTEDGQVTSHDRDTLARIAVDTANNLAERLGCADRLPAPPENIPALPKGPIPAARAEGTCAWYREGGFARQDGFPDQVLEARTDGKLWDERCLLVLSGAHADGLWRDEADTRHHHPPHPDMVGEWWVSLHTYSGEQAKKVAETVPGKAGHSDDFGWWASSVCDGKPQIHTMTTAYGYEELRKTPFEQVFRAYVSDVAARRDCTDTTLPASSTFHGDH
ncbi:hypothetical protein [Streptomyces sp. MK5]|uniref:hypothetical protein n=1 Tax=Streptomyces sp. MK5 TaxID=3064253 RepID=UPI0027406F7B|nr:hypothetical protein [Streptomyces sp. MK5]